jgi:hypothetical protein
MRVIRSKRKFEAKVCGEFRHAGIPVIQDIWSGYWFIELLPTTTCACRCCFPEFLVPLLPEAISSAGEENYDEWSNLLGRVLEVITRDLSESGVAGFEKGEDRKAHFSKLLGK